MKGTTRTLLIGLAMATILATVTTGAALAGKCDQGNNPHCAGSGGGGGGGTGSLTGPVMVYDANGNSLPNYGDSVTFNVSTSATDNPQVSLKCYQTGVLVLDGSAGFGANDPWAWAQIFTLATAAWTSGAANCTATLYYYNGHGFSTLATLGFQVDV